MKEDKKPGIIFSAKPDYIVKEQGEQVQVGWKPYAYCEDTGQEVCLPEDCVIGENESTPDFREYLDLLQEDVIEQALAMR